MNPRAFLTEEQQKELEECIRQAELKTSGEIRIHIERTCDDPFQRGKEIFTDLNMQATAQHNGVLFYIAVESRKFAILGDEGIDRKVPPGFWDAIKEQMAADFSQGRFHEGLKTAVLTAGEQLGTHFPHTRDDVNELPDTISFGEA